MRILFFDTSCEFILVGLYTTNDTEIKEEYFYSGYHPREASFRLLGDIETALKAVTWDKPDLVVCCKGPGSFTGIRISVTTARNLAQIWNIPVLGLDTIEMYSSYYANYYSCPAVVTIDGKQKKVFCGYNDKEIYKGTYDIFPSEISNVFKKELSGESINIISDTDLVSSNYNILFSLPNPIYILKKEISTLKTSNTIDNSFSKLLPNYMRETYAHKP
ncbi:MAG: tRNA (adenosine(37)-N6)-threonylcarbamoyltransferase complex dimerization subunit type 1 TsaB [Leptospiraceae bacterium]|nr:tRNA (adenosine(37)-N6)-threonylcarbamoyltransferase complex dimerization subunit type 1 TsaB [Leptospiraceae bacterium]